MGDDIFDLRRYEYWTNEAVGLNKHLKGANKMLTFVNLPVNIWLGIRIV